MYYLNARYYNPRICRFISPDTILGGNRELLSYNLYAYCSNNPVMGVDPSGKFVLFEIVKKTFEKAKSTILNILREHFASSDSLLNKSIDELNNIDPSSFNCFGNAIGKVIYENPLFYHKGKSTRETYNSLVLELGNNNIRELSGINDSISSDEYKVAMRCGPEDYHFIRQLDDGSWYNKSGNTSGVCITKDIVLHGIFGNDIWYPLGLVNNILYYSSDYYYDDEIIYFAVKKGWDRG